MPALLLIFRCRCRHAAHAACCHATLVALPSPRYRLFLLTAHRLPSPDYAFHRFAFSAAQHGMCVRRRYAYCAQRAYFVDFSAAYAIAATPCHTITLAAMMIAAVSLMISLFMLISDAAFLLVLISLPCTYMHMFMLCGTGAARHDAVLLLICDDAIYALLRAAAQARYAFALMPAY